MDPTIDTLFLDAARALMTQPAAPYFEERTRAAALEFCGRHGLATRLDRFGNLLVECGGDEAARPIVLAAHLDHPGFVVEAGEPEAEWRATFLGGVPKEHILPGVPVLLLPGQVPGVVARVVEAEKKVVCLRPSSGGTPDVPFTHAVWDLPAFQLDGDRLTGRACDDLVGCAVALAVLAMLKRQGVKGRFIAVLARAEEVGFQGALMVAEERAIPESSLVISLETSKEMPPIAMGRGVILRVGDRSSIFDSAATRFLAEVAADMAKAGAFPHQRALMSGGTCEATAYQEYGLRSAAVCVALGNYHNCGAENTIQAEYVSLADVVSMGALLLEACRRHAEFEALAGRLRGRLEKLADEGRELLLKRPLSS